MKTTSLPSPAPTRPRTVLVGSLLASSATFIAFCSLVASYVRHRQQARIVGQDWFTEGSLQLGPASMMLMTLLLSVVTVQWAVQSAKTEDRPHQFMALGTTLLFGAAVLNQFWFVYQDVGLAIDDSKAALFFYVVTGAFIAMLVIAMIAMIIATVRSLAGTSGKELANIVQASAFFWHVTVVCYALAWYTVFVTK